MRTVLCTLLLASPWAMAQNKTVDRAAVDRLIFALKDALRSQDRDAVSKLLAAGTNRPELSKTLLDLNPAAPQSKEVWSEVSRPVLIINTVSFPEKDRALANVASVQYGSVMTRNAQLVFLLKRERSGWKIESLQVGPPLQ